LTKSPKRHSRVSHLGLLGAKTPKNGEAQKKNLKKKKGVKKKIKIIKKKKT